MTGSISFFWEDGWENKAEQSEKDKLKFGLGCSHIRGIEWCLLWIQWNELLSQMPLVPFYYRLLIITDSSLIKEFLSKFLMSTFLCLHQPVWQIIKSMNRSVESAEINVETLVQYIVWRHFYHYRELKLKPHPDTFFVFKCFLNGP